MGRNYGQGEQQLILDQSHQIQRILSHFQHVIALRQRLTVSPFPHHGVIAFAVDVQGDQL
ncbi:hypothetical protein D3C81_1358940 [compost metagenome]